MPEKKYHFERLTPIDYIDLDVYEDAIDYVFDNSDVRNVAISGAYSAGKSSVLASYEKKHNDINFLHISLAHFQSPNEKKSKQETEREESVLEGKILNQLIHQIPSEKIPQTNFRVKKQVNKKNIIKISSTIVIYFIAIIYLLLFDVWKNYVTTLPNTLTKHLLSISTKAYAPMLAGIIIGILSSYILYNLIYIQKNKNLFRKLNLQGNEIEIFEDSDDSYFDKYLNEVLYLFENSDADVIVFEDIDRFNANKIFERLHEVNTLANIQLQKENLKVLRFFYLLRDDIFNSKDRAKFFDFIVPIVPVVDSSNSYDQFISHLKKGKILDWFDDSFLQGLSLYIDDMRLLKNIYNEFIIYYNRLNTTELDCNKMLAIISYKNLFPQDFADLQLNRGFIYELFNKKNTLVKSKITEIEELISNNLNKISSVQNECLKSIDELDIVFAHKYLSSYRWENLQGNDLSNFVSSTLRGNDLIEYESRKQSLKDKLSGHIDEINQELADLEKEKNEINNRKLHQLITRDNIDTIFAITSKNEIGEITDFNEIKSSEYFDLLKYLIRNGYIDETYADYMTYFYENSLNRIDKTFLRSISDKKSKEYTYQLINPKQIISKLKLIDFEQEEVLNFDLLTYLLKNSLNDFICRLIEQLKSKKNFKFIGSYFDMTTELPTYVQHLNIYWPEMFITALDEQSLTEEQICKYSVYTLYYSDDNVVERVNKDNCLSNYISNSHDYLAIDNPKIDKLIHGFKQINVRFVGFDYVGINKDFFYAVYKNSLYEINVENLHLIQREILKEKNEDDLLHKNYTLLYSHLDSPITNYVNQNINQYFDVVLQYCDGLINDNENVAADVLSNTDITLEHKKLYISALRTIITYIKEVKDITLWPLLLDTGIIKYSECNVLDFFKDLGLTESLISYINRSDIDFANIEYDNEIKENLFDKIVICNEIDNSKYKQILESLGFYYDIFDIEDIDCDKIDILINSKIIRMSEESLLFIREHYQNKKLHFIQKNIEKYIDIMNVTLFSQEELLDILNCNNINDKLKIDLLKFSDEGISIIDKNYSTTLNLYILNKNLLQEELPDLFSTFKQWESSVQAKILEYACQNIDDIIYDPASVPNELKNELFSSAILARENKIDLLIAMMPDIDKDYVKDVLSSLNLMEYLKIFDGRYKPRFKVNDENKKLLEAFKFKNYIKDFEECEEKEGYYKIIRQNKESQIKS